jgi:hypothetical protein
MDDLLVVERLQSEDHLVENGPHIVLLGEARSLLCVIDFCLQITVVAVLHNDAET